MEMVLILCSRARCYRDSLGNNVNTYDHTGAKLCSERRKRGLTLEQVSEATNIREDYLNAIENLAKEDLPSSGYVLGYVRTYANFLNLDAGSIVALYKLDSAIPENLRMRKLPHFVPQRKIRLPRGFVPATTVLAVAAMLMVWYGTQTELQAASLPGPDLSVTEAPQVAAIDPNMLTVRALAPSWIQIKDKSNRVIISRIFVSGETWQTPRGSGVTLSARDGGAIGIFIGDVDMGVLGQRGVAISDVAISN